RRLSLVLCAEGGLVSGARRIALLLREYCDHLSIVVPYKAGSAATLLCLAANELVLGPLSELGPIDPHCVDLTKGSAVAVEDIRAYRTFAERWFNIRMEEGNVDVLSLLSQRIFPASLGAAYRADQYVRRVARELLEFPFPHSDAEVRDKIVDQLIT